MTARLNSTGNIIIHQRGQVLALRPAPARDASAAVERLNGILRGCTVTGECATSWACRTAMAQEAMRAVLGDGVRHAETAK